VPSRRSRTGGGTSEHRNPGSHGTKLRDELASAIEAQPPVRTQEGVDPSLVFKLRTRGGFRDEAKLTQAKLQWLGNTADWTYFVMADDGTEALQRMLNAYVAGGDDRSKAKDVTFFEGLVEILPYDRSDREGPGLRELDLGQTETQDIDVVVWPSPNPAIARDRLSRVRAVVEEHEGVELSADDRFRYTIVRVRASGECISQLLDLGVVERIRTPPVPYLEPTTWRFATEDELPVPAPRPAVPIGLIDDEVIDHPLLLNSISSRRSIPDDRQWAPPSDHGTFVAGLLVCGDVEACLAGDGEWSAAPTLHVARVLEPDPVFPDRAVFPSDEPVHLVVEQAIRGLHQDHGVRVFNLSITDSFAFDGAHLSLWSERMDELVRELDIILVVAAGNQRPQVAPVDQLTAYPSALLDVEAGIAEPGPAANVLTVGALARNDAPQRANGEVRIGDRAVAAAREPSPFTRTGPGVAGGIKPDVVHFGGNWVVNDADILEEKDHGVSVVSLRARDGRLFGVANGTSYAAPRVSRLAAEILARYPDRSANFVRALIGATARPVTLPASMPPASRRRTTGNGLVSEADAIDSGRTRVALWYEGEIEPDSTMIHPIPIPNDFVEANTDRRITVALAFDPEVRRTRRDYLTATMKVDLVRGLSPSEIGDIWREQPPSDDPDHQKLPKSQQTRLLMEPKMTECDDATLQVRTYERSRSAEVTEQGYHVVLRHLSATWFEPTEKQRYSLVVVLSDEEREGVDLRASVQARLGRLRVRPRG
jgi:hypothetical protein